VFVRTLYYKTSCYTTFFVKLFCIDMHISFYKRHLDSATYKCLWEKNDLGSEITIQTLPSGAFRATTVGTCGPHTILTTSCRAICYHTLRSVYIQAIKWRPHRRSRELPVTETDAELMLRHSF
jgi:hypothetical protein